jgi:hypothetical protein
MTKEIFEKFKSGWQKFRSENIRFLGYGEPHVPDQEERVFHAFARGFRAGWDSAGTTKQEERP